MTGVGDYVRFCYPLKRKLRWHGLQKREKIKSLDLHLLLCEPGLREPSQL